MIRSFISLAIVALVSTLTACSAQNSSSGTVTAAGSTALLPLVKQAAADYQARHPNAKISVSGGGSRVGITQAAQKGVDIGDSDIPASGEPSLVDHQVAVAKFVIAANPADGVSNLSRAQVRDIFTGKLKNFKDVGGKNQPITIINRPRSSGTRAVFVERIMGGTQPTEAGLTQDSSGTVATMLAQTPGAISYLASSYVKPGALTEISLDGVAPSDANVISDKYGFWSFEHMFTNGKPSAPVADFIAFVKSDTPAITKLGFIPVSRMGSRAR
jgi:phosphate transport system substrate-binding protein